MQAPRRFTSPSSRGLGHRPFTAVTGVRIPLGTPIKSVPCLKGFNGGVPPVSCAAPKSVRLGQQTDNLESVRTAELDIPPLGLSAEGYAMPTKTPRRTPVEEVRAYQPGATELFPRAICGEMARVLGVRRPRRYHKIAWYFKRPGQLCAPGSIRGKVRNPAGWPASDTEGIAKIAGKLTSNHRATRLAVK